MASCQSKLAKIRIDAADWPVINDIRLGSNENHVLNELQNHGARLTEGEQENHSRLLRFFQIGKHLQSLTPSSNSTFIVMDGVNELKGSSRMITELFVNTSMLIRRIMI